MTILAGTTLRLLGAAAVVLTMAVWGIEAAPAEPVNSALEEATRLLERRQAEKAVDLLERTVAAHPGDARSRYWLARAYGEVAQRTTPFKMMSFATKARAAFERAVALDPRATDARLALVEFYLMAPRFMGGGHDKAAHQATEISKYDPASGDYAHGQIAAARADTAAARTHYLRAVRRDPNSALARYRIGVFLMLKARDYDAAEASFTTALQIDSTYIPARFQLGHVAALSGRNVEAGIRSLEAYLTMRPRYDDPPLHRAHYWLGVLYEKVGRHADARRQFAAALRLEPHQKDARAALKRLS
jgi:tetratricopeptide (TPR) repeat protein